MAKIVIVLTSHDRLGDTGRKTGFFFEELATPYWAFVDAGYTVEIASIAGGPAVHDPTSLAADESARPSSVRRFLGDEAAMAKLSATLPVAAIDPSAAAAVFLPGGHGTMWDFPGDPHLTRLIASVHDAGGVVGAVCHGPAGLVGARRPDGSPLVAGRRVTSFTDAEEAAVGLADVVPFLLESRLRELGALFVAGPNFASNAVRDGRIVTGQNPTSSGPVAELMLDALVTRSAAA